jgi:aminoglycoside phosphotransferase (APT) family kinase protein
MSGGAFAVSYRQANGGMGRLVVRIAEDWRGGPHDNAKREARTLSVLSDAGVPVPELLLADLEGTCLGAPLLVLSFAGRPLVSPRQHAPWLRGLAEALVEIHSLPASYDFSHLENMPDVRQKIAVLPAQSLRHDALAREAVRCMSASIGAIGLAEPALTHHDYWPANVLWQDGNVSAIIDWNAAEIGDPRNDVAQCRVDLAMMHGLEASDQFLDYYQSAAPRPLADVWFFDLLRAVKALEGYEKWYLPAYLDVGLEVTAEVLEERLRGFLRIALAAAS